MFLKRILLLLPLLAAASGLRAQVVTTGADTTQVNTAVPSKKQLSAADSAARTERLFHFRVTRPTKAAVLAIVPGGGQIYNKRYWKLPLVYGLLGGLAYGEYFYQSGFREYADAINYIADHPIPINGRPGDVLNPTRFPGASQRTSAAAIQNYLIYYRRNRDLFILYMAGGYGLQILDALVDAHLHDFDVSDDLTFHWEPALLPVPGHVLPGVGLTASLRVK